MNTSYKKLYEDQQIEIGDIIALHRITGKVVLADTGKFIDDIIGICVGIDNDMIEVQSTGKCDVNTTGIICVGDKLTISYIPGKARAIKYNGLEERQFRIQNIGKVIGMYDVYDKCPVILNLKTK